MQSAAVFLSLMYICVHNHIALFKGGLKKMPIGRFLLLLSTICLNFKTFKQSENELSAPS